MMRSDVVAAALLCASASCIGKQTLELPAVGDHRSMITFAVGDDGSISAYANDLEGSVDLPLRLNGTEAELYLLYFRSGLRELRIEPGPVELTSSEPCARPLPESSETWTSRAKGGRAEAWKMSALPENVSRLRLEFSTGSCPNHGALDVDLRCGNPGCFASMRQDDGCNMIVDLEPCRLEDFSARIDRFGTVCIEPNDPFGTCVPREPQSPDVVQAFSCDGGILGTCELDIYAKPTSVPPLRFETVRLFDAAPIIVTPRLSRPPYGWLGDLLFLDDRVVVTAYGGVRDDATFCQDVPPGRVYFLDPESMATIGTATTPSCLGNIARDPLGTGFVGVYDTNPPYLARFTKEGRLIASIPFLGGGGLPVFANSIATDAGPPAIAAFVASNEQPLDRRSYVFAVDLDTMTENGLLTREYGPNTRELTSYAPGVFSALEDNLNGILFIDLENGIASKVGALGLLNAGVGQFIATNGLFVVSMNGTAGGVFTLEENGELKGRARSHSAYAESWSIAAWPSDPRLVLAGMTAVLGDRGGYLALVDLERPRFLPGVVPVGEGQTAVGRFHKDARDRLWAVLPWSAEVIRVFEP